MATIFHTDFHAMFDAVRAGTHHEVEMTLPHLAPNNMVTAQLSETEQLRAIALQLFPDKFMLCGKSICSLSSDKVRPMRRNGNSFENDDACIQGAESCKDFATRCISAPDAFYADKHNFHERLVELTIRIGNNVMFAEYKRGFLKYVVLMSKTRRDEYTFYQDATLKRRAMLSRVEDGPYRGITMHYYMAGVPQHVGVRENVRGMYETEFVGEEHDCSPNSSVTSGSCFDYKLDGSKVEFMYVDGIGERTH